MSHHFGRLYLTPSSFLDYARDLKLSDYGHHKPFLEFLEREELLAPVLRIQFPPEYVRARFATDHPELADDSLSYTCCPDVDRICSELDRRRTSFGDTRTWGSDDHPLDEDQPDWRPYLARTFGRATHVPWEERRHHIGHAEGRPLYESEQDNYTYFHWWQIFQFAACLDITLQIHANFRDHDVLSRLWMGAPDETLSSRTYRYLRFTGSHELTSFESNKEWFELLGRFVDRRQRLMQRASWSQSGDHLVMPVEISGERLDAFRINEKALAHRCLNSVSLGTDGVVAFLRHQCTRWVDCIASQRLLLAGEYRSSIARTVSFYRLCTDATFETVVDRVGHVDGHGDLVLNALFPSWLADRRKICLAFLHRHVHPIVQTTNAYDPRLTTVDYAGFLSWLEGEGLIGIYWHVGALDEYWNEQDLVGSTRVALELTALGVFLEHVLNALGRADAEYLALKTLSHKLLRLWRHDRRVQDGLRQYRNLVNDNGGDPLPLRLDRISALPNATEARSVLVLALHCWAVRNRSVHTRALALSREQELDSCFRLVALSVVMWNITTHLSSP